MRVVVDSVKDCYAALGSIHAMWRPVQGRFKDYIAMPKFNLYQSLHTTVVGPQGKPVEVQIRTQEMHRRAEFGIAAHWGYKEREPADDLAWLQRMVDWQQETSDPGEFMESLKIDLEQDEVFVFTPKGKVDHARRPAPRRSTSRTRSTPRSATAASARASTAAWCRSTPRSSSGDTRRDLHAARSRARARAATGCSSCTRRGPRTKIRQWFSRERRERRDRHRPGRAHQGAAPRGPAGPEGWRSPTR